MTDLLIEYRVILDRIKDLFIKDFDRTKRILISSEQLSSSTILDVFFDLSRILDEIYLMMDNPSEDNVQLRCRYIKGQYLAIQNQCIFIFIYNNKKELQKNKIDIEEINQIISEMKAFLIEKKFYSENNSKPIIDKFKATFPNQNEMEKIQELNKILIEYYKRTTNILIPNWDVLGEHCSIPQRKKNKLGGIPYIDKFKEMLIDYNLARTILIDILTRQGRHYHFALTDLWDALDHINKSFDNNNDTLLELSYASEHIRRAAMESLQTYTQNQFDIKNSSILTSKKDEKYLYEISKLKKEICIGRYIKADSTWYYAIDHFYNALELLDMLE